MLRSPLALLLVCGLLLIGCGSGTPRGWEGVPEAEVKERWGEPHQVTEAPGQPKVLHYESVRFLELPTGRWGGMTTHRFWCRISFEISAEGKVLGAEYLGNDCRNVLRAPTDFDR